MKTSNPFEAPETADLGEVVSSGPVEFTQEDEKAAVKVRRAASWLLFFGVWSSLFGVQFMVAIFTSDSLPIGRWFAPVFLFVGVLELFAGTVLWRWHAEGRYLAMIALVPMLFFFPLGTSVAVWYLIALTASPVDRLLTPEHRAWRKSSESPRVSPRTPLAPLISPFVILGTLLILALLLVRD